MTRPPLLCQHCALPIRFNPAVPGRTVADWIHDDGTLVCFPSGNVDATRYALPYGLGDVARWAREPLEVVARALHPGEEQDSESVIIETAHVVQWWRDSVESQGDWDLYGGPLTEAIKAAYVAALPPRAPASIADARAELLRRAAVAAENAGADPDEEDDAPVGASQSEDYGYCIAMREAAAVLAAMLPDPEDPAVAKARRLARARHLDAAETVLSALYDLDASWDESTHDETLNDLYPFGASLDEICAQARAYVVELIASLASLTSEASR